MPLVSLIKSHITRMIALITVSQSPLKLTIDN